MRLVSHTVWSLVGALAYLGAISQAADGVLDIGLVFPRQNETYAPMQRFPIIFALQNAKLAQYLEPIVDLDVLNGSMTMLDKINERTFDLKWANYTREPYLLYAFMDFEIEGPLQLLWTTWWRRCDESGGEVRIVSNSSDQLRLHFDIKQGAQKADLVEATANEEKCPPNVGVVIAVTDKTQDVPKPLSGNDQYGTCAFIASPSPAPTSNPCRVKIDEATAESMEADEQARRCRRPNPPSGCPEKDNAYQKLAVAGGATLAAALGVAAFLLV
ncbi:uncharacterized protein ColSpa_07840 [Colletotrichum spaethianum]|uniref:DUF7136 domain-containing protein n=1 Tax=Colletotrichum spaethianum TaxID=700344 RepID=A0AA37P8M2_9PEZI|nr:uncharacterized protein ColSpa_07840 [Colletotrichum spaethianum]GKT47659.1 hypothetical protein ColSpa_07840 [Colletotrichum spaethianum]